MTAAQLSIEIRHAFGGKRAPRRYLPEGADLRHSDYRLLAGSIAGRDWEQVAPGFFDNYPELMFLLSNEGFAHYLPRMMLDAVSSLNESTIGDDLVTLLSDRDLLARRGTRDYYDLLTKEQRKAVLGFLTWVLLQNGGVFLRLEEGLDWLRQRGGL